MIKEFSGNIFDLRVDAITHGCNCEGYMGAGIAKEFKERYSDMFREYQQYCKLGMFKPGQVHFYRSLDGSKPHVINIATQETRKSGAKIDYIRAGLKEIEKNYQVWGLRTLAMPKIGCGLGGLKWDEVKTLIYDIFTESTLEVVVVSN